MSETEKCSICNGRGYVEFGNPNTGQVNSIHPCKCREKRKYRQFTKDELKWIKSLEICMSKAPESLFMFIGDGAMVIYTKDNDNFRYLTKGRGGYVDGRAPSKHINSKIDMDGGDW